MSSKLANKFPIPENFPEILHDYSREVVRYRPKDILDFSIQYFYFLDKSLPFHYTEGGSSQIPSVYNETLVTDNNIKHKKDLKSREISSPSITTDQATGNMFYKPSSENNVISIKRNKDINNNCKIITPIESEMNSVDKDNGNSKSNNQTITPGNTFYGISGTESQKGGVRNFVEDVIKNSENEIQEKLKKELTENKGERGERLSTFSGISGTESEKGGVRNFVKDVFNGSIKDVNEQVNKDKEDK